MATRQEIVRDRMDLLKSELEVNGLVGEFCGDFWYYPDREDYKIRCEVDFYLTGIGYNRHPDFNRLPRIKVVHQYYDLIRSHKDKGFVDVKKVVAYVKELVEASKSKTDALTLSNEKNAEMAKRLQPIIEKLTGKVEGWTPFFTYNNKLVGSGLLGFGKGHYLFVGFRLNDNGLGIKYSDFEMEGSVGYMEIQAMMKAFDEALKGN